MGARTKYVYFSDHRIAFYKEIEKHPDIAMKVILSCPMNEKGQRDEGEVIGLVAAHFNIVMDGMYKPEDLDPMYMMLTFKMMDDGKQIILPAGVH